MPCSKRPEIALVSCGAARVSPWRSASAAFWICPSLQAVCEDLQPWHCLASRIHVLYAPAGWVASWFTTENTTPHHLSASSQQCLQLTRCSSAFQASSCPALSNSRVFLHIPILLLLMRWTAWNLIICWRVTCSGYAGRGLSSSTICATLRHL